MQDDQFVECQSSEQANETLQAQLRQLNARVVANEAQLYTYKRRLRALGYLLCGGLAIFGLYQGARLAWASFSSVPNTLVYQGHLTQVGGSPVSAGTYDVKFEFYDAATSGTLKCDWTSTNVRINASGNFRAEIGDSGSGAGSCSDIQGMIRDNGSLYFALSIKAGSGSFETFSPRIKIGGVARAHHAQNAVLADKVSTSAGAPATTDCSGNSDYGRVNVDTTNHTMSFCSSGGWRNIFQPASKAISSNYTITPSEAGVTFFTSNSPTLTLPSASAAGAGFTVHIKQVSGADTKINPGSNTIDGSSDYVRLSNPNNYVSLQTDGAKWYIVNENGTVHGNSYRYYRLLISSVQGFDTYEIAGISKLQFRIDNVWQIQSFSSATGTIGSYSGVFASASSNYSGYEPYKAFNPTVDPDIWFSADNTFSATSPYDAVSSTWIKVDFGSGNAVHIDGIRMIGQAATPARSPDVFELQGSNDNISWVSILDSSRAGVNTAVEYEYTF